MRLCVNAILSPLLAVALPHALVPFQLVGGWAASTQARSTLMTRVNGGGLTNSDDEGEDLHLDGLGRPADEHAEREAGAARPFGKDSEEPELRSTAKTAATKCAPADR